MSQYFTTALEDARAAVRRSDEFAEAPFDTSAVRKDEVQALRDAVRALIQAVATSGPGRADRGYVSESHALGIVAELLRQLGEAEDDPPTLHRLIVEARDIVEQAMRKETRDGE